MTIATMRNPNLALLLYPYFSRFVNQGAKYIEKRTWRSLQILVMNRLPIKNIPLTRFIKSPPVLSSSDLFYFVKREIECLSLLTHSSLPRSAAISVAPPGVEACAVIAMRKDQSI